MLDVTNFQFRLISALLPSFERSPIDLDNIVFPLNALVCTERWCPGKGRDFIDCQLWRVPSDTTRAFLFYICLVPLEPQFNFRMFMQLSYLLILVLQNRDTLTWQTLSTTNAKQIIYGSLLLIAPSLVTLLHLPRAVLVH